MSAYAAAPASDSIRSLVRDGSTLMPGPMVDASVTVRMYLPLAADGFARMSSSMIGLVVLEQLLVRERRLADGHVHDRGAVGAVLDLAGLGLLDGLGDVHRHGADLRVRHLARRAEDAAEPADDRHHVRRRDRDVEVHEAVLDARGEVLGADDVRAGLLGLLRLVALGEDGDLDFLAEPVRQRDRAAQLLVRVADVEARCGSAPRRTRRTSPAWSPSSSLTASCGVYSRVRSTFARDST